MAKAIFMDRSASELKEVYTYINGKPNDTIFKKIGEIYEDFNATSKSKQSEETRELQTKVHDMIKQTFYDEFSKLYSGSPALTDMLNKALRPKIVTPSVSIIAKVNVDVIKGYLNGVITQCLDVYSQFLKKN